MIPLRSLDHVVDRKDLHRLLLWPAAYLLEQGAEDLEKAVERLLRLPHIGDHIAGPLPSRNMELTSGRLSVAGCLELLDDLVVVSERVFRSVRDHENGHGVLPLTRRLTAKREEVYGHAARLGGQRVPVSGRVRGDASDIADSRLGIEGKHRQSLPAWLREATAQAVACAGPDQIPVAILHAHGGRHDADLCVMRLADLQWLTGEQGLP